MNNYKIIFKIIAGVVTGAVSLFLLATTIYYFVDKNMNDSLQAYIDKTTIVFVILMFIIFLIVSLYFFLTAYKLIKNENK